MNFFLSIVTIPATIGANVLNIGKNLAKMMALPPCFKKKSLDCTRYFFLNQKSLLYCINNNHFSLQPITNNIPKTPAIPTKVEAR
jgi:hypothetical protein